MLVDTAVTDTVCAMTRSQPVCPGQPRLSGDPTGDLVDAASEWVRRNQLCDGESHGEDLKCTANHVRPK